ncbi:phosphoribosylformylglycinamidine cyclo-ligase [Kineosporia sp. NBRC 101731]|uniref:phosphoribosylformylglycinamidine cyclo-ligase n=1 Tax=Kineosporia sp. NBRC 101731 TaxID=3032199 RepID=UPI00249FA59F|nr:phosphoribosylformylglycinamidine cyclo-ligase [Kineosporia sp. NBRC 101731]GLY27164.1 phosphoribosylformylglycinamidine cyclo-ligase [Kineosporia sp. NBRC 101731]
MASVEPGSTALTYASAGVDTEAGDRAVELMKASVKRTQGPEVLGGLGGFAGLYDASFLTSYRRPLLATSTDGVGTKIGIARALDIHDTIGIDLVGMVVDDIVVCGARPLFMTDYIAVGKVVPERIAAIVSGIAKGCELAGTALVGGETAEHPGLMAADEYDVAGAATGVVEADDVLSPERVRAGDVVIGLASSGMHSNGYSLVRSVLKLAGWSLERDVPELGRTIGEELLEPTRIYTADVLAAAQALGGQLHAVSHVTGGGLAANLARVLPAGTSAVLDRSTWSPQPVFDLLMKLGSVPLADAEGTFNLGVGMVLVVDPAAADRTLELFAGRGLPAWVLGQVGNHDGSAAEGTVQGTKGVDGGAVRLVGNYRA